MYTTFLNSVSLIWQRAWVKVTLASLFIALCSQIALPLPFTPIPVTMQTLAVALVAAKLGKKLGTYAVALYLAQGAMGLPVFAGFHGSVLSFIGPQGGYLLGFLPAAFLMGYLMERRFAVFSLYRAASFFAGSLVIWLFGALQLAHFVGWDKALLLGVYPFIIGNLLKVAMATVLTRRR